MYVVATKLFYEIFIHISTYIYILLLYFNLKIFLFLVITMENVFQLIGNAYTSVLDDTLMELTNLQADEIKQKCLELDWILEPCDQQLVVYPKKPAPKAYNRAQSEYQLSKLTEFVSFLEN